jgi:adenylate kinase
MYWIDLLKHCVVFNRYKFLFFGPPGSGKGTQAQEFAKAYGVCHLSTGDILRAAVKEGTPMGKAAKAKMDAGELVSDDIVTGIIRDNLDTEKCKNGYIIDGYPRSVPQAQSLQNMLRSRGQKLDHVIALDVDDETVVRRISGRYIHERSGRVYNKYFKPPKVDNKDDVTGEPLIQRNDDKEPVIRARLKSYHEYADQLLDYYDKQRLVRHINANRPIEAVRADIKKYFDQCK